MYLLLVMSILLLLVVLLFVVAAATAAFFLVEGSLQTSGGEENLLEEGGRPSKLWSKKGWRKGEDRRETTGEDLKLVGLMEWDAKTASLDFSELEQEIVPDIGLLIASRSSSSVGRQKSGLNCSVDLKIGGLGEFGSSNKWKEESTLSKPVIVSPSGSAKRARSTSASQNVACLVDGCKSDLSKCREYHRRHKVCEAHSKTPIVLVGGEEQRFCQQCSRFHLLEEFDEAKRSCRKRLDGHNKRRRKPQVGPTSESLFPNNQGSRFLSYPQIFPSAIPNSNWSSDVKKGVNTIYRIQPQSNVTNKHPHSVSYPGGKQFPFLQDDNVLSISARTLGSPVHPSVNAISSSDSGGATSRMFSDGLTPVVNSDCALSLLSSPSQISTTKAPHVVSAVEHFPFGQPLIRNMQNYVLGKYPCSQASNSISATMFSCPERDDENGGVVLISDTSDADLACQDISHIEGDGLSCCPSHAVPFSWQ